MIKSPLKTNKGRISFIFLMVILFAFLFFNNFNKRTDEMNTDIPERDETNSNELFLYRSPHKSAYVEWWLNWSGDHADGYWNSDKDNIGIGVDSEGYVYIASFTVSYGAGETDILLIKYSSSGQLIWNKTWGYEGYDKAFDIAISENDDIFVVGYTGNVSEYGDYDIVLLKYNTTGNIKWNVTWGGKKEDMGRGVALDTEGNIYVVGTWVYGFNAFPSAVLIKFNSTGHQQWYEKWYYGAQDNYFGEDVALDNEGYVYITGWRATDEKLFLIKYNNSGQREWDKKWSIYPKTYAHNLAIDSSNDIYITGEANEDIFLIKYNESGDEQWYRIMSSEYKFDEGFGVEIDSHGDIYVSGTFHVSTFDFGLFKYDSSGDQIWNLTWGTNELEHGREIVIDSDSNLYFVGVRLLVPTPRNDIRLAKFSLKPGPILLSSTADNPDIDGSYKLNWNESHDALNYSVYEHMSYITEINETVNKIESGTQELEYNLFDKLSGDYYYVIVSYNELGNRSSNCIHVNVTIPAPYFINTQENFLMQEGDLLKKLTWTPLDVNAFYDSFWVERNGTNFYNGTWDGSQIIYSELYTLSPNIYNFTCFVNNTKGKENCSTVIAAVLTNNIPYIINNSNNFSVNVGATNFLLSWHANDFDGNNHSYWIECNNNPIWFGFWNNDIDIDYTETTLLDAGLYNYTCFVNDTSGMINQSSIFVKINKYPYASGIKVPLNNIYSPNANYIFNCSWLDNDGTIQVVKFEFSYYNYTVTTNFSGEFTYTITDLTANETGYNFRWHAMDNDGTWNSTNMQSFILNKNNTQILLLFNGTEGNIFNYDENIVNITIINLNSTLGTLQLYVESELKQEQVGFSLINISQYPIGVYNITAILMDENYTGSAMKWLYIRELTPPEILFEISKLYLNTTKPEYFNLGINVMCTVNDYSSLTWVYICHDSSGVFANASMLSLGNGNWMYSIDISNLNWSDVCTFYFYANDSWGNIGKNNNSGNLFSIEIFDFKNPTTILNFLPINGTNIVNKSVVFSLIANDGIGSGISAIWYKINDSIWINYTGSFSLYNYSFGDYIISYYAVDKAGNIEEVKIIIVRLLDITPETPIGIVEIIVIGVSVGGIVGVISVIAFKKKKGRMKKKDKKAKFIPEVYTYS